MNEKSAVELRRRKPNDDNASKKPLEIIPKKIKEQQNQSR